MPCAILHNGEVNDHIHKATKDETCHEGDAEPKIIVDAMVPTDMDAMATKGDPTTGLDVEDVEEPLDTVVPKTPKEAEGNTTTWKSHAG